MKYLFALFLGGLCSVAVADELTAQTPQVTVESYRDAQDLDIAHVVASTEIPDVCGVVPVQMTYDDSKGIRHTIAYHVMGTGCTH
ncbi:MULTISPECIES: DUF2790 domain-containing protein [Pseudomonas]|uniref:DUF2790 domain-containing protein n=1 Tax=Pseudomonas asplenii TaxID=53407 RepID=A0A0N0E4N6_9PSED|nr:MULTISPECIES: DUF2790 domain-containing protein [Pseudomonas]KPA91466.1 Protein of unknown function (DUF2790) [Pseudomonas fuscovaginae]KPA99204.1 Protein of unknown function (DUF2790) [Pseudomonas fuscovaginae]